MIKTTPDFISAPSIIPAARPNTPKQITVREAREAGRYTTLWLQQNIDAPDDAFRIAAFAWKAMAVAHRPDNAAEFIQRAHRNDLLAFRDVTLAWPIYE